MGKPNCRTTLVRWETTLQGNVACQDSHRLSSASSASISEGLAAPCRFRTSGARPTVAIVAPHTGIKGGNMWQFCCLSSNVGSVRPQWLTLILTVAKRTTRARQGSAARTTPGSSRSIHCELEGRGETSTEPCKAQSQKEPGNCELPLESLLKSPPPRGSHSKPAKILVAPVSTAHALMGR